MEKDAFNHQNLEDDEHEEIPEAFVCCVCLDILYKPIVLSCGHICCFWCVHKSMNGVGESQCPVCRNQYYHFPTICQMLHFLLLKVYPVAYKRRENQTLEEEKETGYYSPQFGPDAFGSHAKFGHSGSSSSCSNMNLVSSSCTVRASECMEQSGSAANERDDSTIYPEHSSDGAANGTPVVGEKLPQNELHPHQKLSVADVMCTICKQLLFRPVVLNCGHVHCETCITNLPDEMLRCQVCESPHPRGFPKVCLELDHFLQEQFPEEYAQQRDAVQLKQIKVKPETPSSCSLDKVKKGENMAWWSDPDSKVHIGVGCDFCGMYPVIGDRYKCIDCKEKMGFDLCGDCYNTRSKLPGRFNQQHTAEHRFKLVRPDIFRHIMLSVITGQLGEGSIDPESFANIEFTTEDPSLFGDGEHNQNDSEATD